MPMATRTARYKRDGTTYRMTVEYGFDEEFAARNSQRPYFSLTCSVDRRARNGRWMEDGGGCMHEEIVAQYPDLEPLVKWHLADNRGLPMHYVANGEYWAWGWRAWPVRENDPNPVKAFKGTVVFGSVEGDEMPDLNDESAVREWLERRIPALREAMLADMVAAGVEVPGEAVPA